MLKLFCVPNNLYTAIAVLCNALHTHTRWPHPQYKPKSVRFRQNNINKQTVTDKTNEMTKCPESTLSARLVPYFPSFVGWCFSHIYKNTMLLHRWSVHSVPFAISHLFSAGSVHWKYFHVSLQTNRLVYKHPEIFSLPKLKIQSTNRNLHTFLGQFSCTVSLCVFRFWLCV